MQVMSRARDAHVHAYYIHVRAVAAHVYATVVTWVLHVTGEVCKLPYRLNNTRNQASHRVDRKYHGYTTNVKLFSTQLKG